MSHTWGNFLFKEMNQQVEFIGPSQYVNGQKKAPNERKNQQSILNFVSKRIRS